MSKFFTKSGPRNNDERPRSNYGPRNNDRPKRKFPTVDMDFIAGTFFDGKIRRIVDFGIFVELVPGKDGLVHISTIAREKQATLERDYKVNDILKVKVIAYDKETGRVRLVAPELEKLTE